VGDNTNEPWPAAVGDSGIPESDVGKADCVGDISGFIPTCILEELTFDLLCIIHQGRTWLLSIIFPIGQIHLPVSISLSCSNPSSRVSGPGLQRPGDDIGVMVDARVSGPMSVSRKDQVTYRDRGFSHN